MKEFLLFRLYGPMASWGEIAVGEYRPSFSYPSKSAICGMVAAALGIERSEDEEHTVLAQNLSFAVSVNKPGTLLRDYHTIQTPGNANRYLATRKDELADRLGTQTILSIRDYRVDAVYDVCLALRGSNGHSLMAIRNALVAPKFTLYLGRKSCVVAWPLGPKILSADSVLQAFEIYRAQVSECWQGHAAESAALVLGDHGVPPVSYVWEEENSEKYTYTQTRRDSVWSRRRWQFAERREKIRILDK